MTLLAALLLGLSLLGVDGDDLSRDIADTAHLPWWTGALSTVALMLWTAAAAVSLFVGVVIVRERPAQAGFLFATAALVAFAAIDDAFQLHETVAPEEIGVSESVVYAILGTATVAWAVAFWRQLLASRWWLLGAAAIFFAGSLLSDILTIGPTAAEDWLKSSGISILLLWCADTSWRALSDWRLRAAVPPVSAPRRRRAPGGATPPPGR